MARVLIIGDVDAELGQAARIAQAGGARIAHADGVSSGLGRLRSEGADLVLCELSHDVAWLVERLAQERIACPVIACGRDGRRRPSCAPSAPGRRTSCPCRRTPT